MHGRGRTRALSVPANIQAEGRRFETCTAHQRNPSKFSEFLSRGLRLSLNKAALTATFDSHRP
jgi:hypothetical protein